MPIESGQQLPMGNTKMGAVPARWEILRKDPPYLTNAYDTQVLMVRPERQADADRRENLHLSQGIPDPLLNPSV